MENTTGQLELILKILAVLQGGTLVSILLYGYKVVKFFNTIEFKTDLMWADYQKRLDGKVHYHRRTTDNHIVNDSEEDIE